MFRKKSEIGVQSVALRTSDRIAITFIGVCVIFAALGMGEAVYRLLFFEFDGATDRLPIEALFGIAFAWMAMKLVEKIYQSRLEASERIRRIQERNFKIRHAVGALAQAPYGSNQQAIRVIREQVDHIDWTLTEMMSQ